MNRDIFKPFVGEKAEFRPDELVCYCFGHTRKDIEQNYLENGTSTIMAKITAEKKGNQPNKMKLPASGNEHLLPGGEGVFDDFEKGLDGFL